MLKLYYYFFASILLLWPVSSYAQNQLWYFPIQGFESRSSYKTFNQYIDKSFYLGKESLFPTQFTGYHVGDDLEINKDEENQDVPVYAVSDGKISFIGPVNGYGGVILLDLTNDSHTALYGHLRLNDAPVKTGATVKAGQILAYLGKGFSSETGGERKHLHFAIYNGKGAYFHGYENSESTVQSKWVNPAAYLKQKNAQEPGNQPQTGVQLQGNTNQNGTINSISTPSGNTNKNSSNSAVLSQPDDSLAVPASEESLQAKILQYLSDVFLKIRSIFL